MLTGEFLHGFLVIFQKFVLHLRNILDFLPRNLQNSSHSANYFLIILCLIVFSMKKLFLLLAAIVVLAIGASAQTQTITGTVLSATDNEPLLGASVMPVGGGQGTSTDVNGNFHLTCPAKVTKIQVSYIGMQTKEVEVGSTLRIYLDPTDESLKEVVVTGYGSAKKLGSVVGAVSVVSDKVMENKPVPNFVDALQGQVAGLSILSSSGDPSSVPAAIRIRGVNSISASNTPLFILDGSPVSASVFNTLSPNDIENITVLKDAASVAIYGSRAANGVIVITSKRGRFGERARVTVRANVGWSEAVQDPVEMMNSKQYLQFREMIGIPMTQQAYDAVNKYGIDTDWSKEFIKDNAMLYSMEASVSGGGENNSYYLSLNHYDQDGIIARSGMHRDALRASMNIKANEWLRFGFSANLGYESFETNSNVTTSGVYAANPLVAARRALPVDAPYYWTETTDGDATVFNKLGKADYLHFTQIATPDYYGTWYKGKRTNVTANVTLWEQINPIKGLTIRAQQAVSGYDYRLQNGGGNPIKNLYTPMGDSMTGTDPEYPDYQQLGYTSESFQRMYQFTYTNTAEYKFSLADKHNFTVLLGQESIIYKSNQFGVSVDGITDERMQLLGNGTKPITIADNLSQSISEMTMNSFFGTLNYDYEGRYVFDGSLRRDGSSKFATGHRWSTFFSLGVAWNAKNEKFLQDVKWLSDAKIRLSYGTSGNSGVGYYDWQGLIGGTGSYDGNPLLGVSQASNHTLTWETVKGWDLGINIGIFNRLNVELDFYTKKTCDMLLSVPWSATTGYSEGVANMGNMTNKGFEATFNATLFQNKDWLWTARVNFAYNKNEITELFNGKDSYVINNTGTILEVGKPYGSNYMVRYAGVDPADGKQMWYDKDGNLTKVFNEERDAVNVNKSRYAPWHGGFGTALSWKGLTLQLDFAWQAKKYMTNNDLYFIENPTQFGTAWNQTTKMLNMWQKPGDITDVPAYGEAIQFDTRQLQDASFLRLKNVTLSYALPKAWMNKAHLGNVIFHFTGRNLLTFTNFKGYDPEPEGNLVVFHYPNTRNYEFGVEVQF